MRASERAWRDHPRYGCCESCGKRGRLQSHHVVPAQEVRRRDSSREFDVMNRMLLGTFCCHPTHHGGFGVNDPRISRSKIPPAAVAFARGMLGDYAEDYLRRYYRLP